MTEAGVKRRRRLRVLEPRLMREVFPDLANDVEHFLLEDDVYRDAELARTVRELRIHGLCPCGDEFCLSFYTAPAPVGERFSIPLNAAGGMTPDRIALEGGRISYVEITWGDWEGAADMRRRYHQLRDQTVVEIEHG